MVLTTHILSGAVIGAEIKNPFYVAIISIAVHFLLDLIPHGDYLDKKSGLREFWKVALDIIIGLGSIAAIFFIQDPLLRNNLYARNIGIGIFFSLLPDGITFLYWKMGVKFLEPIYSFHQKLHRAPDFSPKRRFCFKNNPWDILISLIALIILFSLR